MTCGIIKETFVRSYDIYGGPVEIIKNPFEVGQIGDQRIVTGRWVNGPNTAVIGEILTIHNISPSNGKAYTRSDGTIIWSNQCQFASRTTRYVPPVTLFDDTWIGKVIEWIGGPSTLLGGINNGDTRVVTEIRENGQKLYFGEKWYTFSLANMGTNWRLLANPDPGDAVSPLMEMAVKFYINREPRYFEIIKEGNYFRVLNNDGNAVLLSQSDGIGSVFPNYKIEILETGFKALRFEEKPEVSWVFAGQAGHGYGL